MEGHPAGAGRHVASVGTPEAPEALGFPGRKQDGRPVTGPDGRLLAAIRVSWTGTSFSAVDAAGDVLCAASVGLRGLSRTWVATGPGRPLLSLRRRGGSSADVTLVRGGAFRVQGSVWTRDVTVIGQDGATVVSAVPASSAWSFHPHDDAVRLVEPAFDLAELVALVQIWRTAKRNDAAGGAAAAMA